MMNMKLSVFIFYTFFIAAVWYTCGFFCGFDYKSKSFKNEAVVQGVAEYIPDDKGSPVWQWKK